MSARTYYQDYWINPRIKIAALWTSMMFVFAYVDLFSMYRADIRADIEAGKLFAFTIGQGFLLGVTIYIVVPSLLLFLSLVLPVRVTRIANMIAAVLYAVTIAGGAIGEWNYYGRHRRVELLHPGQHHRGRLAGRCRLLRMDLAEVDRRWCPGIGRVAGRYTGALRAEGARLARRPVCGTRRSP